MVCAKKIYYFCYHDHRLRRNVILNNIIVDNITRREKLTELVLQSAKALYSSAEEIKGNKLDETCFL